jgi:sugar phosphate isomerase/epimerase
MTTPAIGLWLNDLQLGMKEGLRHVSGWPIEALGIDAFCPELDSRVLSSSGRRDLARQVRNTGATVTIVRADVGGRRLSDAATLDTALGCVRQSFGLARELNAVHVTVPLGFVPDGKDASNERTRNTLKEALAFLVDVANSTGVRPAVVAGRESSADLKAFLDAYDSAGFVEVDLNPGGVLGRGEDPVAALNTLSARVALATVLDHFRGGNEAAFGRGDVAWPELLVGLSALSRPARVALLAGCTRECDRSVVLRTTLDRLRQLRVNPFV